MCVRGVWRADAESSPVSFIWSSDESVSVVLGQNLSLECVAEGVPAPSIVWEKYGGVLPSDRHAVTLGAHQSCGLYRSVAI